MKKHYFLLFLFCCCSKPKDCLVEHYTHQNGSDIYVLTETFTGAAPAAYLECNTRHLFVEIECD